MDANRKLVLAVALGVLWVGLAVWQWSVIPEPVHVPLANVSGPAVVSMAAGKPSESGLRVNLELLDAAKAGREAAFTAPRNIFAVPHLEGRFQGATDAGPLQAMDPNAELALQQQAAQAELSQYRYLGFLRMADSRNRHAQMAVLSKNEAVVVVKVGDRFDERLILKTLTPDSVTIRDTGARIDHTVPLSEESVVVP